MFRGEHKFEEDDVGVLYARDVEDKIKEAELNGRKIAAFLSEPFFAIGGVFVPPKSYFSHVYRCPVYTLHSSLMAQIMSFENQTKSNYFNHQGFHQSFYPPLNSIQFSQ